MSGSTIETMTRERREAAERLQFFDANIWLGQPEYFPLAEEISPGELDDVLAQRFVTGGLVSHWQAKRVSAQDGNAALTEELEGQGENLFAVWAGLPLYPSEGGSVPGSVDLPSNVRGVRIFPKSHNYPLAAWSLGTLCEWLVSRSMPLFIWHTEFDWIPLYELIKAFPRLKVVVESQWQKILYHARPLFAAMRDLPNILVEISNFAGQGFLDYAVKEFGAERFLFGSFLPVADPFVPIGMIIDARISEEEKGLIAGENLRRIIEEVRL